MDEGRLITIPFSHFCEKARWVLDATGVRYREEPHAPLVHRRATGAVGARTVPVLVHNGSVLRDSSEIACHAEKFAREERRLIPAEARAEILAMEDDFDETLGVDARLLAYWYVLGDAFAAREFVGRAMRIRSPLVRRTVAVLFRALIFRRYEVSAETAARAEARVRKTFARLASAVDKGGYLVAGRFTLADLTLGALAAPLLGPPEHPIMGRAKAPLPPGFAALRKDLAEMPVGRHVLRVYREHRATKSSADA